MAEFIAYLIAGIATGAIYALAAIGFTLVWQTSQTINFAQGEFVMLPAVLILLAVKLFGLPLWAGGLLGIAVFLLIFGALYLGDGLLGLATGSGYLDLGIINNGMLDLPFGFRVAANAPHILLGAVALAAGLRRG